MAENEILCIANAARYRATRRCLRMGATATLVADRLAEDVERGLRNSLAATFRKGETLLTLLRAACIDRAALRAVVANFQDKRLARLFSAAIKSCGAEDPLAVVRFAGRVIEDQIHEQTLHYAAQCEEYKTPAARDALAETLALRFEQFRPTLLGILESSVRGERVQRAPRVRTTRASTSLKVKELVETSLLPLGARHRHGARNR